MFFIPILVTPGMSNGFILKTFHWSICMISPRAGVRSMASVAGQNAFGANAEYFCHQICFPDHIHLYELQCTIVVEWPRMHYPQTRSMFRTHTNSMNFIWTFRCVFICNCLWLQRAKETDANYSSRLVCRWTGQPCVGYVQGYRLPYHRHVSRSI